MSYLEKVFQKCYMENFLSRESWKNYNAKSWTFLRSFSIFKINFIQKHRVVLNHQKFNPLFFSTWSVKIKKYIPDKSVAEYLTCIDSLVDWKWQKVSTVIVWLDTRSNFNLNWPVDFHYQCVTRQGSIFRSLITIFLCSVLCFGALRNRYCLK